MGLATLIGALTGGFGTSSTTLVTGSSQILGGFGNSISVTGIGGTISPVNGGGSVVISNTEGGVGAKSSGFMKTFTKITGILFLISCLLSIFTALKEIWKLFSEPTIDTVIIDSKGFDIETGVVTGYVQAHNFIGMIRKWAKERKTNAARMERVQAAMAKAFGNNTRLDFKTPKIALNKKDEFAMIGQAADVLTKDSWIAMLDSLEDNVDTPGFKAAAELALRDRFAIRKMNKDKQKSQKCGICPEVMLAIIPGQYYCTDEKYTVKIESAAHSYIAANGGDWESNRDELFKQKYLPSWLKSGADASETGERTTFDKKKLQEAIQKICDISFIWLEDKEYKYKEAPAFAGANQPPPTSTDEIIEYTRSEDINGSQLSTTHVYVVDGEDENWDAKIGGERILSGDKNDPPPRPTEYKYDYQAKHLLVNDCSDPYYWIQAPEGANVGLPEGGFIVDGDDRDGLSKADYVYGAAEPVDYMEKIHKKIIGDTDEFASESPGIASPEWIRAGFRGSQAEHWGGAFNDAGEFGPGGGTIPDSGKQIKPFIFKAGNIIGFPFHGGISNRSGTGHEYSIRKFMESSFSVGDNPDVAGAEAALVSMGSSLAECGLKFRANFGNRNDRNYKAVWGKVLQWKEWANKNADVDILYCSEGAVHYGIKRNRPWFGSFVAVTNEPTTNCNKCTTDPSGSNCVSLANLLNTEDFVIGVPYVVKVSKSVRSHISGDWVDLEEEDDQTIRAGDFGDEVLHEEGPSKWKVCEDVITPPCKADTEISNLYVRIVNHYSDTEGSGADVN